jgi:hypothetical protein
MDVAGDGSAGTGSGAALAMHAGTVGTARIQLNCVHLHAALQNIHAPRQVPFLRALAYLDTHRIEVAIYSSSLSKADGV